MAEEGARSRLGRGLAALIGDVGAESSAERPRGQRRLPTGSLRPNARNPRRAFADAELDELAASLRERGIIQPIVARPLRGAADSYEIIAGERRWRAAQRAGLHEVPVVVIEATDAEALQLAIIENVQRADLNPLEEADGYRALIDEFGNSQDEIAKIVGKSRSHVANTLAAPETSRCGKGTIFTTARLTAGHARMLDRPAQCRKACAKKSLPAISMCAKSRRWRASAAQKRGVARGAGRKLRGEANKNADVLAFEKRVSDATRPGRHHRRSQRRRHAQHPLSQARTTRRVLRRQKLRARALSAERQLASPSPDRQARLSRAARRFDRSNRQSPGST